MSEHSVLVTKVVLFKRIPSEETEIPGIQTIPVYACRLIASNGAEFAFDIDKVEIDVDRTNCAATVHITAFNLDLNLDKVQIQVD